MKNVATSINKENLLLTHYSHILPSLKDVKHVARTFSTYFDNNKLKNETRKLAKKCDQIIFDFLKVSSVGHVGNNPICISPKELSVQKLPF